MEIRAYRADESVLIKRLRLRSLADAPYAFGRDAFAEEAALPDAYWHQLATQVSGHDPTWGNRCVSYVALDGIEPCGTVTCYRCPQVERRAYLSAAWIDPRYRRRGLGRRLVGAAIDWATAGDTEHLRLWVDDTNPEAGAFYQVMGFVPTGECQPVSSGSSEMQTGFQLRLVAT